MFELRQTETFEAWLTKLKDGKAKRVISRRLDQIVFGHFGDSKSLGDHVFEMRIHLGPGYRLYYTEHNGRIVILLCAGHKGTQKRDITRAKKIAKEQKL